MDQVLTSQGYGVAFGDRVILAELDFSLPPQGVTAVMGPMGGGKSTLLRSLAGLNAANPRFRTWGRVEYRRIILSPENAPPLVGQHAQLLSARLYDLLADRVRAAGDQRLTPVELRAFICDRLAGFDCEDLVDALDRQTVDLTLEQQRRAAILREAIVGPPLLMIDEPTAALGEEDAHTVLELVRAVGRTTAVLLVLHNQRHARAHADRVLLIAGGRIQEDAPVETFFENPTSTSAVSFVRTGGCSLPAPDAEPENLADDVEPPPPLPLAARIAVRVEPEYRGPRDFKWIVPGRVGSTPLPGAVIDINHDLAALRVVGITTLITLTRGDLDQDALRRHGLRNLHLPIYDREAPTVPQLRMLAKRMTDMINRGEVLAVHCRAGIGRTGTVLAGWLINEGLTAGEALARIRKVNPAYVQTEEQEQFLHAFEAALLNLV